MAHADQHEVVDVGGSAVACPPNMVGFAAGWVGAAGDAAAVAGDEGSPLVVDGEADAVAEPEWLAVCGEHDAVEVGDAQQPVNLAFGK